MKTIYLILVLLSFILTTCSPYRAVNVPTVKYEYVGKVIGVKYKAGKSVGGINTWVITEETDFMIGGKQSIVVSDSCVFQIYQDGNIYASFKKEPRLHLVK